MLSDRKPSTSFLTLKLAKSLSQCMLQVKIIFWLRFFNIHCRLIFIFFLGGGSPSPNPWIVRARRQRKIKINLGYKILTWIQFWPEHVHPVSLMYRTVDSMAMTTGDKVNLAWSFAGKGPPDHKKALPECSFVQLALPLMKAPGPNIWTAKQSVTWPFFSYFFFHFKGTYAC